MYIINIIRKCVCFFIAACTLSVLHANENDTNTLLKNEILNVPSPTQVSYTGSDLTDSSERAISLRCRFVDPIGNIDNRVLIQDRGHWSHYEYPHPMTAVFLSAEDYQTVLNRCVSSNPQGEEKGEKLTDIITVPINNFSHDVYFSDLGRQNIYPFDRIIFFGDSLSDNSNDFRYYSVIMKMLFPGTYWNKRFTSGFTWLDWVSTTFNLPEENFAYGGAYSFGIREHMIPDLATQMTAYLNIINNNHLGSDEGTTLFSILIGANDFLSTDHTPEQVANVVSAQLNRLITSAFQNGAQKVYLLAPTVPDISKSPSQFGNPLKQFQEHQDIETYNSLITQDLYNLQNNSGFPPNAVIVFRPNFENYLNQVIAKAPSLSLNVTDPCMIGSRWSKTTVCSDPQDHVFWDGLHPSATIDCMLGQKVADYIQAQLNLPLTYPNTRIGDRHFLKVCQYSYIQS